MLFMITNFTTTFEELGNSIFGSTTMFMIILIIMFVIIMIILNIPSTFVLIATAMLSGGMFYLIENTGFIRILLSIIGLVFGVMLALFILGLFYHKQ